MFNVNSLITSKKGNSTDMRWKGEYESEKTDEQYTSAPSRVQVIERNQRKYNLDRSKKEFYNCHP